MLLVGGVLISLRVGLALTVSCCAHPLPPRRTQGVEGASAAVFVQPLLAPLQDAPIGAAERSKMSKGDRERETGERCRGEWHGGTETGGIDGRDGKWAI
jgi:hypothetical protein